MRPGAFWIEGARVVRYSGSWARSVLLATALTLVCTQHGFAGGTGGGGGGLPEEIPAPPPNLLLLGSSFTWFLDPLFQVPPTLSEFFENVGAIFVSGVLDSPTQVKAVLKAAQGLPGGGGSYYSDAVACLGAIKTIIYHDGTPGDSQTYGTWAQIQQMAADQGTEPVLILAWKALNDLAYLWALENPTQQLLENPFFVASRSEPASTTAVAFAEQPAGGFPPRIAQAYTSVLHGQTLGLAASAPRWTVWASGYGGYSSTSGNGTSVAAHTFGSLVGLTYNVSPQTAVGFALGGSGNTFQQAPTGSGSADAMQFAVYGIEHFGAAYAAGWLDGTTSWTNTTRLAAADEVTAKFNSQSYGGRLEGGYRYALGGVGVTPYAAVQLQYFHTPSYSETDQSGGGMGVSYNASDVTDTRSELGAYFDKAEIVGIVPLMLRARVAWAHDWISNSSVTAAFEATPATSFILSGLTPAPDSALTTLQAEIHFAPHWSLAGQFDGQFASASQTYVGSGTLRYAW